MFLRFGKCYVLRPYKGWCLLLRYVSLHKILCQRPSPMKHEEVLLVTIQKHRDIYDTDQSSFSNFSMSEGLSETAVVGIGMNRLAGVKTVQRDMNVPKNWLSRYRWITVRYPHKNDLMRYLSISWSIFIEYSNPRVARQYYQQWETTTANMLPFKCSQNTT